MRHLTFIQAAHDMNGRIPPTIPSILKKNEDQSLSIVTDGELSLSDTYSIYPIGGKWTITDIIESRKAKGDWSGESYKGMNPTFSVIRSIKS
jgi:hypothetical protein